MSQLAQPVPPPPPPPPPAGVIVCAPAAAPATQVWDASPPAGPSPPALPSPPQLCASLRAQEAPLDLSAFAGDHRSEQLIPKVNVEQEKQEVVQRPPNLGSNILRSQLSMQREVQASPALEQQQQQQQQEEEDVVVDDGCEGPQQKRWRPGDEVGYPEPPLRAFGSSLHKVLQLCHPLSQPTPVYPGPGLGPRRLRQRRARSPLHVQIPDPSCCPGGCAPQRGSAFSAHPGRDRDRDPEVRSVNYQVGWVVAEQRAPELVAAPPPLAQYSPGPYILAPHVGQLPPPPMPPWPPASWMSSPVRPMQQPTPPEVSSAGAAGASPRGAVSQAQGRAAAARPFKTFSYEEHLGEPATHEARLGRLATDTRESYDSFIREKRAQLPEPAIDFRARNNAQSPDVENSSSTEESAEVAAYRARRQKNNLAAKRSRAARHVKEDDIALTSMYFCDLIKQYRHALGMQKIITQQLERQLASSAFFRQ